MQARVRRNVGPVDRWIRGLLGVALVVLGGWTWGGWQGHVGGLIAVVVGAVLVVTALVRFCPLYRLLGVSTCKE